MYDEDNELDEDSPEVQEVFGEIDSLQRAWRIFVHEMSNGRDAHLHNPPALVVAAARIFESYGDLNFEEIDGTCVTTPRAIVNYGAQMFEFAQKALQFGVLAANMRPCKCLEVSDDDIAKLLGEANEK